MRPVASGIPITQSYGIPSTKYAAGFHTGTDFGCPTGTRVNAPHNATVARIGRMDKDYGNYVQLRGSGGHRGWLLAHLSRIDVVSGQHVPAGRQVGLSGATGNVTGPHLHAEERHPPFGYRDSQVPTAWKDPGAISHA